MSVSDSGPGARTALIARLKAILLSPKTEWPKIEAEPATVGSLYTRYVLILAALPAIAGLIGSVVFGHSLLGVTYRPSVTEALTTAIIQYVGQIVGVFILALIIDALAPTFGGQRDRLKALKLSAYAATASWLAGCFAIFPPLAILSILGLYSLYLVYTGLPLLMKAPQAKAVAYTATVIVAAVVLSVILGAVVGSLAMTRNMASAPGGTGQLSGTVKLPGGATLDMGALQQAADSLAAGTGEISPDEIGQAPAVDVEKLKALMPDKLPGGFERGDITASSVGAAGMAGSSAEATYFRDDANLTLTIADMGVLGAMTAFGSALGINATEETESGYSRTDTVDGRMTMEELNRDAGTASYATIVANRVMVSVAGQNVDMDAVKQAMKAIDLNKVEKLTK